MEKVHSTGAADEAGTEWLNADRLTEKATAAECNHNNFKEIVLNVKGYDPFSTIFSYSNKGKGHLYTELLEKTV